jgi:lipoprotein-anchoring transpeptidase ErfK/SrfK
MPARSLKSSLALVAIAASIAAAPQAHAQDNLFEFLWGGSQEFGGGKQTVSFDSKYTAGQIIVSFGDRRLYLITKAGSAISYPVAIPREVDRWQGTTSVTDKRVNPAWRPTPDMLRENPKLPLWVPGGHRMNPLGVRAMYLGSSLYRIHGTDAPWTIGQAVSKGCIRMLNEDVLDLYPRVPVGTKVTVTWQRFSSQAIASDDSSAPMTQPMAAPASYKAPPRSIRVRTPSSTAEAFAAAADDTAAPAVDPTADDAALAAAAEKPLQPKPVKKAEVHKKTEATAATGAASAPAAKPAHEAKTAHAEPAHDAATAAAERAAAAATKAAEAAAKAAEAARKAAEDAKKAAAEHADEAGKSASL